MGVKRLGNIKIIKLELTIAFEITDIGLISFYLELKVKRNQAKKTLKLLQPAYIDKILAKYYLNKAKLCNTLMKEGISLLNKDSKVG